MARPKDDDGIKSEAIIAEVAKRPVLYDANHQSFGERALKAAGWQAVCAAVLPHWASMGPAERYASGKEIQKRWRSIRDSYTKAYRQGKCVPPGDGGGGGAVGSGRRSQHRRQMVFLYHALQRKVPRTSTDGRVPDPATSPPPGEPALGVVKVEAAEEPPAPTRTYQNKKRSETRTPSIENSSEDSPSEPPDVKPIDLTKMEVPCGVKHASTETVLEFRSAQGYTEILNPSLEIKIDANSIHPDDHFEDDRLFMNSLLPFFKRMDDERRLTCRIEVLRIIRAALQGRSFECCRPEGPVKEEKAAEEDATGQQKRSGRKRKSVTPYQTPPLLLGPAPKRRGRGRPRKTSPPRRVEDRKAASESEEEAASRRRRRRRVPPRCEREWESRLTPDEEEMYRATSVAQLKPPQFLKMYNLKPTPPAPAAADAKKDAS